jgi:hypothetical protein
MSSMVAAYCPICERWAELDLPALVALRVNVIHWI